MESNVKAKIIRLHHTCCKPKQHDFSCGVNQRARTLDQTFPKKLNFKTTQPM